MDGGKSCRNTRPVKPPNIASPVLASVPRAFGVRKAIFLSAALAGSAMLA
ncbi:hypothetical protein [Sphingopyxis terrae]